MPRPLLVALSLLLAPVGLYAQQAAVSGPDSLAYRTTPQGALFAHVFRPAGPVPATGRAAIVILHGGGWEVGEPSWMYGLASHYTQRGMVAVPVQYRLSNQKDVSPIEALDDVRTAIRFLRANAQRLGIDPSRIAAYGTSAGGHLAAAAALVAPAGDSGAPNLLVLSSPAVAAATDNWFRRLVGTRANPATLSPDSLVRPGAPPALLLQGEKDLITPLAGAQGFCARMQRVRATCELITYPNVGHLFARNLDHRSQEQGPRNSDPEVGAAARAAADRFLGRNGYIK